MMRIVMLLLLVAAAGCDLSASTTTQALEDPQVYEWEFESDAERWVDRWVDMLDKNEYGIPLPAENDPAWQVVAYCDSEQGYSLCCAGWSDVGSVLCCARVSGDSYQASCQINSPPPPCGPWDPSCLPE